MANRIKIQKTLLADDLFLTFLNRETKIQARYKHIPNDGRYINLSPAIVPVGKMIFATGKIPKIKKAEPKDKTGFLFKKMKKPRIKRINNTKPKNASPLKFLIIEI